jgi:DNA-binding response OmpR family regulator
VNILLVEDHADTRSTLTTLLRHSGHNTIVAATYLAALRLLVRVPADVLVCDLGLPDGDGLDLVGKAKTLRPRIKTIAMTARASEADRESGLKAGFDHYLTKPFDFHTLRIAIGEK